MGYQFLNIFFFVFHTLLMLFNCFGWIWKKTRRWNLITLFLTAFSWFVLGIWYGWGYCLCTDWHWEVREKLGLLNKSNSYIHFLLLEITGINFSISLVETTALVVFLISILMSIGLNIHDYKRK